MSAIKHIIKHYPCDMPITQALCLMLRFIAASRRSAILMVSMRQILQELHVLAAVVAKGPKFMLAPIIKKFEPRHQSKALGHDQAPIISRHLHPLCQ